MRFASLPCILHWHESHYPSTRKFDPEGAPILDAEGNPDTSFLAKIPADTPFTFQMLDQDGCVLAMAQTWHQVRPGEVRNNCGGCHAHSQRPLDIATTLAGRTNYIPWDLTRFTTLLTKNSSNETTLSVKADFTVNGRAAGTGLAGLGTLNGESIWTLAIDPPLTSLPTGHLSATVLDSQGNRTTVKVRFWVAPADFRVLSLDATHRREGHLDLRFENPDAVTPHTILWTGDVSASLGEWTPLSVLDWEAESNRVHRIEVQVPPDPDRGFLRIRQR